jgi:lactate dehydrogenase-like 2-hydroxyacid dehydrogenase
MIGFDADQMERQFPEVVDEKDGVKAIAYGQLSVVAIKAIQEQQALIDQLVRRIDELEAALARR